MMAKLCNEAMLPAGAYILLALIDPLAVVRASLESASPGLPSVKIGVVDGLPDLDHSSLRGASIEILASMIPDRACAPDQHGTQICSIIFGTGDPIQGIAKGCSGLVLPIFFGGGRDGRPRPASQLDLARAVEFALQKDVSIINVSAGQKVAVPEGDDHLEQALRRCAENRVLVVAAAGNDGCACLHLPAAKPMALAVGAAGLNGRPLDSSNWGEPYQTNGILAPGENLAVANPGGGVARVSGTSYATAVVSGVAALLLSAARREGCRIDAIDVRDILLETAIPCDPTAEGSCERFLVGVLDATAALAAMRRLGESRRQDQVLRVSSRTTSEHEVGKDNKESNGGGRQMTMLDSNITLSGGAGSSGLKPAASEYQTNTMEEPEKKTLGQQGAEALAPASVQRSQLLTQQACSCNCGGGQPPQLVYAIGTLWFDFGTEARHDLLVQHAGFRAVNDPARLVAWLREPGNKIYASGLTFILMQDQIPLYAIAPTGAFASDIYDSMFGTLASALQDESGEQRVSLPGYITGSTRLMNGMTVPVVVPDLRGMFKWKSSDLITAAHQVPNAVDTADEKLLNFLNKVYYELRNMGVDPRHRALNFAATNAYQASTVFSHSAAMSLVLDSIDVQKSPICRPDSDCWDVVLTMFDDDDIKKANQVYKFTVDVSEVIPVTVGQVRNWATATR